MMRLIKLLLRDRAFCSKQFTLTEQRRNFHQECHSPLLDWNAVVDESATEEAMVVLQNLQKGISDSELS